MTLRVIAGLARILVALVAMELSGLVHLATDLLIEVEEIAEEKGCPNEKPGGDCPPGCPGCHCAHGGLAAPPSSSKPAALPFLADERPPAHARPDEADGPSEPLLPSIFRPPRRTSLS